MAVGEYFAHEHDAPFAREISGIPRSRQPAPCGDVRVERASETRAQRSLGGQRAAVGHYDYVAAFKVYPAPRYIVRDRGERGGKRREQKIFFHTDIIPEIR